MAFQHFIAHKDLGVGSSPQLITAGVNTLVLFPRELRDIGGRYNASTSRWRPGVEGVSVALATTLRLTAPVGTTRIVVKIQKNDVSLNGFSDEVPGASERSVGLFLTDIATVNDYYGVFLFTEQDFISVLADPGHSRFEGFTFGEEPTTDSLLPHGAPEAPRPVSTQQLDLQHPDDQFISRRQD